MIDDRIERSDHRLAAFEGEALLTNVFCVEKFLEELGFMDAAEDADFLGLGERGLEAGRLDAVLQPAAAVGILDVGVFGADVTAVGLLERGDDVAELHLPAAEVGAGVEGRVEIGGGEVELLEGKFRDGRGGVVERIEVRLEVADRAIGVDEVVNAGLFEAVDDGDAAGGRGAVGGSGERGGEGAVAIAKGETLEKGAPCGVDGVGIIKPGLIHLFDHSRVGAGRNA